MSRLRPAALWAAAILALPAAVAGAQQPATPAAPAPEVGPKIGEMAPDFEFTGITRYGKLANSQKLSDFRGQTVVLAFFPKARTRG
jgi:peroxiredoxin Q/BCP